MEDYRGGETRSIFLEIVKIYSVRGEALRQLWIHSSDLTVHERMTPVK